VNLETKFLSSTAAFAAAAAAATATSANAADLVTKARPVAFQSWQGFYVGGSLGVSWLNSDPDSLGSYGYTVAGTSRSNGVGIQGGLQAGYNWQDRNFVYGFEGDISFLGGGKATSPGYSNGYAVSKSSQINGLGTFRARVGWDFNGTMPYITGGVALGSIKHSYSDTGYGGVAFSKTSWVPGLALGAGVEHMISNTRWTVRGEVMWVGFQSTNLGLQPGYSTRFNDNLLTAKVGLNYRF
jgi:opacity protein-like surface antigen